MEKIVSPIDTINLNKVSADIIPKWNHISTKSADITKLYAMPCYKEDGI